MKVCTKLLDHDAEDKSFTGEVSSFGPDFKYHQNDKGEFCLTLASDLGTEAEFFIVKYNLDDDGDITSWILAPTAEAVERHPRMKDYTVTIFND